MSKPIDRFLDAVEWTPVDAHEVLPDGIEDGLPYATHTGTLYVDDLVLDVVQLNDGRRVITEESLIKMGIL